MQDKKKYYGVSFVFPLEYKEIFKRMQIGERAELRAKVRELVDEYVLRVLSRKKKESQNENSEVKELKELNELNELI